MEQDQVNYLVVEYLRSLKEKDSQDKEALADVINRLEDIFPLANQSEATFFKDNSFYPSSLGNILDSGIKALNLSTVNQAIAEVEGNEQFLSFSEVVKSKGFFDGCEEGSVEYWERYSKLVKKFKERTGPSAPASEEDLQKKAEELKTSGNKAINAKNYSDAESLYTQALDASPDGPNSHVYYSNRAAAYCHLQKYQEAVDDCLSSLQLSPNYVKAYSRLGLAYFFMKKYSESVQAYERAVELEPDNKASAESLHQAKEKLRKQQRNAAPADSPSGGMPDMSSLMGNPAFKNAMDKVGGQPGLANLMNNPQMMQMAQQMMKDPAMMQQAMSMLGGGGGGAPDMSALASMMGGAGGAPGGDTAPSSSSAKKPFGGFED